ncbi:hypothetical protein J4E85_010703 [Alternaria conjuncta]|uniref:uncharacterized protein n=1 Tax=Alternaria conjuncta TaxID=181017 RepID=UPI002220A8A3|nr:uncharacterized protein J4E85_010703 [Alternaria conjuncta]KAI4914191.1 hypothetical protein J4E85_010703 [Alternaria conjuncta]
MWTPDGYVYLVVGNDEIRRHVKILLDPQSPENVISTHCLSLFPGYTYSASAGVPIGTSITGRENYLSIAEVEIRWNGINNNARRFTGPYFRETLYESSTCHVMESDEFYLIIGRPTINRLELFKRNKKRIIAAWRGYNTSVNNENVDDEQESAEDRRKKAKEAQKQREKEEKDKRVKK